MLLGSLCNKSIWGTASLLGIPPPTGLFPAECSSYLLGTTALSLGIERCGSSVEIWASIHIDPLIFIVCKPYVVKVVFQHLGQNRSDSLLKQRGLLYPHLYKPVTSTLRPAKEDKAAASTIDLEWNWFCTSSWRVTISQCHLQLGPPLRSHVCSCAGKERALNTDGKGSEVRDGFHLRLLDFVL